MEDTPQTPAAGKATAGARLAAQRAAKAARKAAQREPVVPLVSEDEIAESVEAASNWFDDNQRMLFAGLAAIVLVGVIAIAVTNQRDGASRVATEALRDGAQTAIAPVIPETEEAVEQEDSERETYPSHLLRAKSALAEHKKTVQDYAGTNTERWARLGVANAQLELGEYVAAASEFKSLLGSSEDPFFEYRVREGGGFALEGQGKFESAAEEFVAAGELSEGVYKPFATLNVARMLLAQGKRDEAIKALEGLRVDAQDRADSSNIDYAAATEGAELRLTELGVSVEKVGGSLSPDILEQLKKQLGANVKVVQGTGQTPE